MEKVFVYGTLKRGFGNNRLLDNEHCTFLGEDIISPQEGFVMLSLGGFPAIIHRLPSSRIYGEVYSMGIPEVFTALDRLEGYPDFYNRRIINTKFGEAWVYFLDKEYDRINRLLEVPTGYWSPKTNHQRVENNNNEMSPLQHSTNAG